MNLAISIQAKTIKAGKHILTIESGLKGATIRCNGVALCMNALKWNTVVDAIAAGKFDDYIEKYCSKK